MIRLIGIALTLGVCGVSHAQLINPYRFSSTPPSGIALVSSTTLGSGSSGGTSASINTTGANLLVMVVSVYNGAGGFFTDPDPTDSKSNTWTKITANDAGGTRIFLYYSVPTSVGTGHTFTVNKANSYAGACVHAYSGAHASPLDQFAGTAAASGTSASTGSITPTVNNCLIVSGLSNGAAISSVSINSGLTIREAKTYSAGVTIGSRSADLLQTTASAINPQWSWTTTAAHAVVVASFKPQ